jgi:hypothetical protein
MQPYCRTAQWSVKTVINVDGPLARIRMCDPGVVAPDRPGAAAVDAAAARPRRGRAQALFPAGRGYHYSSSNVVLLGLIVERVACQSVEDVLRARILRPLGLQHTFLPATDGLPAPNDVGYYPIGPHRLVTGTRTPYHRPYRAARALHARPNLPIRSYSAAQSASELCSPAASAQARPTVHAGRSCAPVERPLGPAAEPTARPVRPTVGRAGAGLILGMAPRRKARTQWPHVVPARMV